MMRRRMSVLLLLGACSQPNASESNQTVIDERAKALERATDAAVDQSIMQMARENPIANADTIADENSP